LLEIAQVISDWSSAAQWFHLGLMILAAIGTLAFLVRTRFWFPRYVHWLAAIALGIGFAMLWLIPADAPVNRGDWVTLKKSAVVLLFPGIVYVAFVFYGGQRAAYDARRAGAAVRCPHCGEGGGLAGDACGTCGQMIPPGPERAA
jgi:hypothetical protein